MVPGRPLARLLAGATIVTIALGALALADDRAPGFSVAVLRRDGLLIPFADYDGKRWRRIWPDPADRVDVPIDLRNVPSKWWGRSGPHDNWQLWQPPREPRLLHVRQPNWVKAQCRQQIGLQTDYRPDIPPPPPQVQPYPKDGLAVAPPQPVEAIEVLPPGSPPEPVIDAFNDAEGAAMRDELAQNGPTAALPETRVRERTMPKVEAIYAVGDPVDTRVYYFELSKTYTDERRECAVVAFGAGWFVRERMSPLRRLRFDVSIGDCERYGFLYMLPLGAMQLSNKLFWIAQWSGWDYEEYGIVEIKPKEIEDVVRAAGGQC